ncbi:MAG: lipocalin family protein [Microscillaceae bacterium]|nr:lipocalin family protein [Microscillaceae bacterium]
MKRVLYTFLIFALFVTVTSCKKKGTKDVILGSWQLESVEGEELTDAEKSVSITFSKDGSFERSAAGGLSQKGKFTVSEDGKSVTITPEGDKAETMAEVKIEKDKFSFKQEGKTIVLAKKK